MGPKTSSIGNATNRAYRAIKEMIAQYRLIPGQKITYDQLAERIKMSKTPIINALNRLEQEGFFVSIPNRGFLVKEIRMDEVEELFRIREALEILAVEESIRNYAAEGIKRIEKALVAHREYDYSTPHRHRWFLDMSFHLKIAEMGKNRNLVQLLRYVLERIYLPLRVEGISPQRLALTAGEHQDVFDAIRRKDTAQAKRLMKKHLKAGKISTIRGTQLATRILQY